MGHRGCGRTGKRRSLPHILSLRRLQDSGWSDPEPSTSSRLTPSYPEFVTSSCSMARRAQFRPKSKPSQASSCFAVSKQDSGEHSCHVHISVPLPSGVHRGTPQQLSHPCPGSQAAAAFAGVTLIGRCHSSITRLEAQHSQDSLIPRSSGSEGQ